MALSPKASQQGSELGSNHQTAPLRAGRQPELVEATAGLGRPAGSHRPAALLMYLLFRIAYY